MLEMLQLTAKYNKIANGSMMECMKQADKNDLYKDVGLYYKSIIGAFEHALSADIALFGGVYKNYTKNPDKFNDPVFGLAQFNQLDPEVTKDLTSLFETRKRTDEAMIKIVDDLTDLNKIETMKFPGVEFKKPRYQMVMSMLIHGAHHRGQIAAALDILGVDNDFGGMLGV